MKIEGELGDHFSREENVLVQCCKMLDDAGVESALNRLRSDHREILLRLDDLKDAAKASVSTLSNDGDWSDQLFVIRVQITNARVFLEKHADQEIILFETLKDRPSIL